MGRAVFCTRKESIFLFHGSLFLFFSVYVEWEVLKYLMLTPCSRNLKLYAYKCKAIRSYINQLISNKEFLSLLTLIVLLFFILIPIAFTNPSQHFYIRYMLNFVRESNDHGQKARLSLSVHHLFIVILFFLFLKACPPLPEWLNSQGVKPA